MNERSRKFFGDILGERIEDKYIDIEIVPAKARPKDTEDGTPLPIEQINREIAEVRELLELEVMA